MKNPNDFCPCQSKRLLAECCGPYLSGKSLAPTPEALMRSRYTAYSQANIIYIQGTMRGKALAGFNAESAWQWSSQVQWLGLEIVAAPPIPENSIKGWVEFKAFYREQGKQCVLHERSEFILQDGRWFYTNGKTMS